MDDLTNKLMELLANKENLKNIKSLSNIINSSTEDSSTQSDKSELEKPVEHQIKESQNEIVSTDAVQAIMKLMPLLSSINKEDNNTRLLAALRPHLSEKRQVKLDESIKMMQMFKILPILKSEGIFNF